MIQTTPNPAPDPVPSQADEFRPGPGELRRKVYNVIFGHATAAGLTFDIALLVFILGSVVAASLETVELVNQRHGELLRAIEWGFTIIFSVEYALRLWCLRRPLRYARSFFGIVDLLAIVPTYVTLFTTAGLQSLLVVRALRLLRVFRILKLTHLMTEGHALRAALWDARDKILVFLLTVTVIVTIVGALMYLVEGPEHGFTSIPESVYWAVVTMTTVGYGDITPQTPMGKALSAVLIVLGYALIVVPSGFVSASFISNQAKDNRTCPLCKVAGHDPDAEFCRACGNALTRSVPSPRPPS
ncbi:MAG: ion transporter [Planctomycetota bacterium]